MRSLSQKLECALHEGRCRRNGFGRRQLHALGQLEFPEVVRVELAGLDVEVLAGQEQAAQAELAIALGVDERAQAAKHGFIAEKDRVGRVSLAARLDIDRRLEPVSGLGQKVTNSCAGVFVFEKVGTLQAL